MFSFCLFVCLFICWQDYAKITQLIFTNFGEKVELGRWDFGDNLDMDPGIYNHFIRIRLLLDIDVFIFLSPALTPMPWRHSVAGLNCWSSQRSTIHLYIHIMRIICFMSGGVCFVNLFFLFPILTSLWHYCNTLFVALLIPFSYEDKRLRGLLCRWPSITEWEMHITAQGYRLRNDLYCVEWDVKLYYIIGS